MDDSAPTGDPDIPDTIVMPPSVSKITSTRKKPRFASWIQTILTGQTPPDFLSEALQNVDGINQELSPARRDMIERVIAFDSKKVSDVMAPRADIVGVEVETSLAELLRTFSKAGHSRLPVYRGDPDDPIGMVHIKDVVGILAEPELGEYGSIEPVLQRLVRKILYVPPSMLITDLLLRMQAARIHMALVIDEFGGTDGLLTIEDLVEEIVGEINDEHDAEDKPFIKPVSETEWEADARLPVSDLVGAVDISLHDMDEEVDTLGGLVFHLAGRVPLRNEVISHPENIEFEVVEADARRVRKIKIRKIGLRTDEITTDLKKVDM